MSVRIVAIRKDNGNHHNPNEAVSHYQWLDENTLESKIASRQEMVSWIENGGEAYVRSTQGTVYCFVNRSVAGTKFLQTRSDGQPTNNLLDLPEC